MLIGNELGNAIIQGRDKQIEGYKQFIATSIDIQTAATLKLLGLDSLVRTEPNMVHIDQSLITFNQNDALLKAKAYSANPKAKIDKINGKISSEDREFILNTHLSTLIDANMPFYSRGCVFVQLSDAHELEPQSEFSKDVNLNQYTLIRDLRQISSQFITDSLFNTNQFYESGLELTNLIDIFAIIPELQIDLTTIAITEGRPSTYEKNLSKIEVAFLEILDDYIQYGKQNSNKSYGKAKYYSANLVKQMINRTSLNNTIGVISNHLRAGTTRLSDMYQASNIDLV